MRKDANFAQQVIARLVVTVTDEGKELASVFQW